MQGETRAKAVAAGIAVSMVGVVACLGARPKTVGRPAIVRAPSAEVPSAEVPPIVAEAAKDPQVARERMKALYRRYGLHEGADFAAAAKVMATSKDREDLMFAHDLAIAGLALGERSAKSLVAETEDRLFAGLGLGERFGTLGGRELSLTRLHRRLVCEEPVPVVLRAAD